MNEYANESANGRIEADLSRIAARIEERVASGPVVSVHDGLDFLGRCDIYEILDDILGVFFPGHYSRMEVSAAGAGGYIADTLRSISHRLGKHIHDAISYHCRDGGGRCDGCDCERRSADALVGTLEALPEIRAMLIDDVASALSGDPAAKFFDEVLLSYPFVEAIATHRIAHRMYTLDVPIIPRIMSERAHSRTGIDIHPGAQIGQRFFIDHGTGVVIGETCRIGSNVKIYQGVTLGATSPFDKDGKPKVGQKRHPDIEDDVIIYANATILGGETVIGKGAVIGGNTWITRSVDPGVHVYNRPRDD